MSDVQSPSLMDVALAPSRDALRERGYELHWLGQAEVWRVYDEHGQDVSGDLYNRDQISAWTDGLIAGLDRGARDAGDLGFLDGWEQGEEAGYEHGRLQRKQAVEGLRRDMRAGQVGRL